MRSKVKAEVLGSTQLNKGEHYLPQLTLFKLKLHGEGTKYVVLQHEVNKYPNKDGMFLNKGYFGTTYTYSRLDYKESKVLQEALSSWSNNQNKSLMCYSYLYAYCKAKGYDLHLDLHII